MVDHRGLSEKSVLTSLTILYPITYDPLPFVCCDSTLLDFMTSGPVVAFEIVGENAIGTWKEAMGPSDPSEARKSAPTSIRAMYGKGLSTLACLWLRVYIKYD